MRNLSRILIVFVFVGLQTSLLGAGIQRIVSLAPSLTMNIYYLGVQSKLVGCTSYCDIAKNDHKQIVANAVKVNLEKVVSLKPDLVMINTSKQQVESLKKKVHAKGSRVFFQIGSDPLFTVLTNTYMNDFILFAGATNIFAELSRGTVTREAVLARDPDIIIVVSMGIAGQEEKKTWESYKQLKAVKKKQVFVIDSELACTPTPVSFVKTFETLVKLIDKL